MKATWIKAVIVFLVLAFSPSVGQAARYLAPNTKYSLAEIETMFRNSGNPYLSANASAMAAMSYYVESGGGNSAITNLTASGGGCCTGLMQMNQGNLERYCGCTPAQYAAMSGQEQINIYAKYHALAINEGPMKTLMQMQAAGQTLGGQPVDAAMIAACVQLGGPNCKKAIENNCAGVTPAQGGDGSSNICTMAAKANAGQQTAGGGGGGGVACLVPIMKESGIQLMSPYGADRSNRKGASKGWHQGLDIVNSLVGGDVTNNPAYAGNAGKTTFRLGGKGGNWVAVQSNDGTYNTVYYHLANKDLKLFSQQKPTVAAGDTIGYIGNTGTKGASTGTTQGTHMHIGMTVKGSVLQSAGGGGRVMATGGCPTCGAKGRPPLSAAAIAAAGQNTYYFVNPEPFLNKQIPVPQGLIDGYPGYFAERANPHMTLPTTCSIDTSATAGQPMSTSSGTSTAGAANGLGSYRGEGQDFATSEISGDTRSIYLNMARIGLDDLHAASLSGSADMQIASSLAHLIMAEQQ